MRRQCRAVFGVNRAHITVVEHHIERRQPANTVEEREMNTALFHSRHGLCPRDTTRLYTVRFDIGRHEVLLHTGSGERFVPFLPGRAPSPASSPQTQCRLSKETGERCAARASNGPEDQGRIRTYYSRKRREDTTPGPNTIQGSRPTETYGTQAVARGNRPAPQERPYQLTHRL